MCRNRLLHSATALLMSAVLTASATPAHALVNGIRIQEIGFACRSGDANTAFVELVASTPDQTHGGALHLEVTSALGAVNDSEIGFGVAADTPWPEGQTWLLAGSSFTSRTGISRDGPLSALQANGGTLTLYFLDESGERTDLDTFVWGDGPVLVHAPYYGQSLQRVAAGFTRQSQPTPTNALGTSANNTCYGYAPQTAWVIDEALFACSNALKGIRYIETRSLTGQEYDPNLLLRISRRSGTTLLTTKLFQSVAWQSAAANSRFLMGSLPFQNGTGINADLLLTSLSDSTGGKISILMPSSRGDSLTVVHEVAYGTTGTPALPPAGSSLQRQASGDFAPAFATPRNRSGQFATNVSCFTGNVQDPQWQISELGLACRAQVNGFWFLELRALNDQRVEGGVGLRIQDHAGAVLLDAPDVLALTPGSVVAAQKTYLIGSSAFSPAVGMSPDLVVPTTLDPAGGTIRVYTTPASGGEITLSELAYGSAPLGIALPPAGGSIEWVAGAYQSVSVATPQRYDTKVATGECFTGLVADGIRINEVGLRCRRGVPSMSFVELVTVVPLHEFSERMGLRVYGRTGALLGDITGVMANHAGQVVAQGATALLAANGFAMTGPSPDAPLNVAPDTSAGRMVLYLPRVDGSEQILSDVSYGSPGAESPAGGSLQRGADNGYTLGFPATPTNLAGATAMPGSCYGASPSARVLIDELAIWCGSGANASFVELLFDAPQRLVEEIGLEIHNSTGVLISDLPRAYAARVAQAVQSGQRFLLGSAGFTTQTGRTPDTSLPAELDPIGGTIVLYETISTTPALRTVYATLTYGTAEVPAPPAGSSLVRSTAGTYSMVNHPTPTDFDGGQPYARCWAPADTAIRISELALACYAGTADTRFLELRSLDPLAKLDPGLGVRFFDSEGTLLEELQVTSAATWGKPWLESGTLLLAPIGLQTATGVAPDVALSTGPSPAGGEVQLFWRDDAQTTEVLLDSWRYGPTHSSPLPYPGGAIVRAADGSQVLTTIQTPRRFDGTQPTGTCFTFQPPTGIQVHALLLQCLDRSTNAQFVEIRSNALRALDPAVGLEVRGADGSLIADLPGLFASHAWQPFGTDASFLLAPATATAVSGREPDAVLPASLDTLGGSLRLYQQRAGEARVVFDELAYGTASVGGPALVPGRAIARDTTGGLSNSFDPANSYPGLLWRLSECQTLGILASLRVSEMSLGCSHDPLDGGGQFIELRNDGPTLPSRAGYFLRVENMSGQKDYPLFVGREAEPFPTGGFWLLTGENFLRLNGIAGDEKWLKGVPTASGMIVRLFRRSSPTASPVELDMLAINQVVSGVPYPLVPFGRSQERKRDGSIAMATITDPRNAAGETLNGASSCLGRAPSSSLVPIDGFSPGCASGGPSSAYISFIINGTSGVSTNNALRLRIRDHTGAVTSDQGDLFSGQIINPHIVGAIGFSSTAQANANSERPFTLDREGGEIMLYQSSPTGPEIVHARHFYGPIAVGAGMKRTGTERQFSSMIPVAFAMPTAWSCYGESRALTVTFLGAGADCGDGDPTTRYLQLSVPTLESCYWDWGLNCSYWLFPPTDGKVRTFDASGALLDSVSIRPAVGQAGVWCSAGPLRQPVFGSGGVAAMLGVDLINRAPAMDPSGGRLQFITLDPSGRDAALVRDKPYGSAAGTVRSAPPWVGAWPTGGYSQAEMPYTIGWCTPCGLHGAAFTGFAYPGWPRYTYSTAVQYDSSVTYVGSAGAITHRRFSVDGTSGSSDLKIRGLDHSPFMVNTSTRFTAEGLPNGTPLTVRARLAVTGRFSVRGAASNPGPPALRLRVYADGTSSNITDTYWSAVATTRDTLLPVRDTLEYLVPILAGVPFRLSMGIASRTQTIASIDSLDLHAQWLFSDLPAGAHVTSCHGFGGGPVPTQLALARAEAFEDHIELSWQGGSPSEPITLERREEAADWRRIADLLADGTGQVQYRDDAVVPGSSYGYRLRAADGHLTAETRVTVPVPNEFTLAIDGGQPVRGPLVFTIARPAGAAAKLELFDVAGRLVASRQLAVSGPARERVALTVGTSRAGIFIARLTSGNEKRVMRVVLVP